MSDQIISERVLQLLEITLKKKTFSLAELADEMSVSTRSVRNYIKELNTDLAQIVSINSKKNKGYYLEIYDQTKLDTIMKQNKESIRLDTPKVSQIEENVKSLENDSFTKDELAAINKILSNE